MAADAAAARVFAEELGIAGEAFSEAINAQDFQVEMEQPENLPVPKAMKKAWRNWCERGHPDKGGDASTTRNAIHARRPSGPRRVLAESSAAPAGLRPGTKFIA